MSSSSFHLDAALATSPADRSTRTGIFVALMEATDMLRIPETGRLLAAFAIASFMGMANAQSFHVQCPAGTVLHPADTTKDPAVVGAAQIQYATITVPGRTDAKLNPTPAMANPGIKCQQLSGGDGFATMADGTQTYLFAFGPLSGLKDIVNGLPGTQKASDFIQNNLDGTGAVLDVVKIGAPDGAAYAFNGAIGLVPDPDEASRLTGHVDARLIMDVGVLNGNITGPMIAIDEGDELFLTLTNVGQVMRPDLFEQHTVHFHGYPNASAFYDGVPDASVAINVGGSFTYYYLAPEAGTYMWHCHISPPEHLQMGMVGQLYVRPKQNSVVAGASLNSAPINPSLFPNAVCGANDLLCSTQAPAAGYGTRVNDKSGQPTKYAYNDGDGSTAYDVEYPIQMHGFDPNFHFVGMTFNPESFADNKDKFFLLNGRSYPDTINPNPLSTQASDGTPHFSQPLPTIINIPAGGKALLRISDLNVTEYHTLASLGIRMHVVGYNARLLRDQDGNNTDYYTNSISLAGGESVDVILDAAGLAAGQKFYLYTPQLDHLSNDAENFGGMMTEVNICASVHPLTKACGN
jgi:FtsP/CotA-like multicopper oxidase with cupredoxin domain